MSKYLPLCNYLEHKTGISSGLWCAFNSLTSAGIFIASHKATIPNSDIISVGIMGFYSLMLNIKISDDLLPRYLIKKQVGLTRGGHIIRASQGLCFAGTLGLSLVFHSVSEANNRNQNQSITDIKNVFLKDKNLNILPNQPR